jgi:hypothetical protein
VPLEAAGGRRIRASEVMNLPYRRVTTSLLDGVGLEDLMWYWVLRQIWVVRDAASRSTGRRDHKRGRNPVLLNGELRSVPLWWRGCFLGLLRASRPAEPSLASAAP